jgi:hypothetical protein
MTFVWFFLILRCIFSSIKKSSLDSVAESSARNAWIIPDYSTVSGLAGFCEELEKLRKKSSGGKAYKRHDKRITAFKKIYFSFLGDRCLYRFGCGAGGLSV